MNVGDSLTLHRVLRHPIEKVFGAWESAELMSRWFSAEGWNALVTSDFRVGGSYRIEMSDVAGGSHVQFGDYLVIERPFRISFTWTCREIGVVDSVVTVLIEEQPEGTAITLTHELLPTPEIVAMHHEGWVRCLAGLERVLQATS